MRSSASQNTWSALFMAAALTNAINERSSQDLPIHGPAGLDLIISLDDWMVVPGR
jgi:hypothetical protein